MILEVIQEIAHFCIFTCFIAKFFRIGYTVIIRYQLEYYVV